MAACEPLTFVNCKGVVLVLCKGFALDCNPLLDKAIVFVSRSISYYGFLCAAKRLPCCRPEPG